MYDSVSNVPHYFYYTIIIIVRWCSTGTYSFLVWYARVSVSAASQ